MLELTALSLFIGYVIYLRYYADQRSNAQIETERLREGVDLYDNEQLTEALAYFNRAIAESPKSAVGYLYRARIYRDLGDPTAALTDLNQGISYDNTIADLHLESGRIRYGQGDYQAAFLDFDKAVFHGQGNEAEPYRWRGLTRQQLHHDEASRQDLQRATELASRSADAPALSTRKPVFFDRRLLLHSGLILLGGVLSLLIIKRSDVIHWPYLTATILGVAIGFLETRKGWVLALQQAITLWVGYYLIIGPAAQSTRQEVEAFSLYGSIGLTFVGSLLGSVIKRAQA